MPNSVSFISSLLLPRQHKLHVKGAQTLLCRKLAITSAEASIVQQMRIALGAWAVVLHRPPQHLWVPARSGESAGLDVPRASVLPRPPQHLQVPATSSHLHKSTRPTGSFLPAPTSTPPGALPQPQSHWSTYQTGIRSPAPSSVARRTRQSPGSGAVHVPSRAAGLRPPPQPCSRAPPKPT